MGNFGNFENTVDYHIHSYYSDGALSPVKLVQKFKNEGYDEIAITDHDGIGGVKEALAAGKDYKIQVVAGVEFSTEYKGIEMHLLGYRFDPDNEALNRRLEEIRAWRADRNERLLKVLDGMGVHIEMEELLKQNPRGYVGKPNIARVMVEKGIISSVKEAFEPGKYLKSAEADAVEKVKIDTAEAIRLILQAGGTPVLAHPVLIKNIGERNSKEFWANLEKLLRDLKKEGLKGLEVFYGKNTEEESSKSAALAAKLHLHMTSGSDYHGDDMK